MIADKLLSFTLLGAGWVLWLLLGLSMVSLTVIIERAVWFWRRRMSRAFPQLLALAQAGDLDDAGMIAVTEGDSMEAEVVRVAAVRAGDGHEAVAEAISSVIEKRRLQYEQGLFILGTLGNNAPFVGLFGTVLGIIRAFADLAVSNKAGAQTVMAGISEALVATAVGLFVAIPAVLAFNIFQRLLKRVIGRSNALAHAVASGMHVVKEVE